MTFSAYNDESGWAIGVNGITPPIHLWQILHLFTQLIEDPELGLRVLQCGARAGVYAPAHVHLFKSVAMLAVLQMLEAPCMRLVFGSSGAGGEMLSIAIIHNVDQIKLHQFIHMAQVAGLLE